jgi:hypothetical protein
MDCTGTRCRAPRRLEDPHLVGGQQAVAALHFDRGAPLARQRSRRFASTFSSVRVPARVAATVVRMPPPAAAMSA